MIVGIFFLSSGPAAAQVCGLTTVSGGSVSATYDPFNSNGSTIANTTIILQRINGAGGNRSNTINFYFESATPGLNGVQVNGVSIGPNGGQGTGSFGGGAGLNLFFAAGEGRPNLNATSAATAPSRTAFYDFKGNATGNDAFRLTANVILPGGLDAIAGSTIPLNLRYSCTYGQGAGLTFEEGTRSGALVLNVTVLSALQARYGGEVLDFGEVGNKTTSDVQGSAAYTKSGTIYVKSSGAYEISMTSDNDYRLAPSQADAAVSGRSLTYTATLVGESRIGVSGAPIDLGNAITRTCVRTSMIEKSLPLIVVLTEGGNLKTPAPLYKDALTVTVRPQVASIAGSTCS